MVGPTVGSHDFYILHARAAYNDIINNMPMLGSGMHPCWCVSLSKLEHRDSDAK